MPRLSEKDKDVRKSIMDPVLAGEPCPPVEEIAKKIEHDPYDPGF